MKEELVSSDDSPAPRSGHTDEVSCTATGMEASSWQVRSLDWDYRLPPYHRRWLLPTVLFVATCFSTFWAGSLRWDPTASWDDFQGAGRAFLQTWGHESLWSALRHAAGLLPHPGSVPQGLIYMAAVLGILLSHEMGHFLFARRHRIRASLPYFIPVPILPFGTLGAVIGLEGSRANRRQIFDLGLAGPLAGLVIALPITWLGIRQLAIVPADGGGLCFHNPWIVRMLVAAVRPDYPTPDHFLLGQFNPLLMAGWVGIFVTGLNMLPISQLDGGHVAYALLGQRAHLLARGLVVASIAWIVLGENYEWVLMLVVVILLGTDHPPTADDHVPLGFFRRVLGWLALAIPIFCFPTLGISAPT